MALLLELEKRRPLPHRVRDILTSEHGSKIPVDKRPDCWRVMLKVKARTSGDGHVLLINEAIRSCDLNESNQRVIKADALRTKSQRGQKMHSPESVAMVERLLTFYCQKRGQKYKQGLNEILSPFILLRDPPLPELDILELFYAFIDRFLPNMFEHEEFYPLQCCLKIFDLLLRYHLPEVCNRLDQYNVGPELYTTPWFLTCFSRQLSTDCLYILWDELLLDVGASPCSDLIFFFGITLVRLSASKIMTADPVNLPAIMAGLEMPNSQEKVRELVTSARQIRAATPSTLCHIIYEGVFRRDGSDSGSDKLRSATLKSILSAVIHPRRNLP